MTDPIIKVTLTDTEFTLGELQEFIDTARAVDGMDANALVAVKLPNASSTSSSGPLQFQLSASTAYRTKG